LPVQWRGLAGRLGVFALDSNAVGTVVRKGPVLGIAVLLPAALIGLGSCNDCPVVHCPASFVAFEVRPTSGVPLNGVTATLSGPAMVTFECDPYNYDAMETYCSSTRGVGAGDYTLTVTASGFQTATVAATVTESHGCCPGASLEPSSVTLVALTPGP
jgi:hypothetical protein